MQGKTFAICLFVICIACTSTVSAFGISGANFGSVELGDTPNISLYVVSSSEDFDNHFVMEKGGEIADWISFSPEEFDLPAGAEKGVTVTLSVPENAKLGEHIGWIKAAGKKAVPGTGGEGEGTTVGYTISLKANTSVNVIKPGAKISAVITDFIAPHNIKPNEIVHFVLSIKNDGNVFTTADSNVTIYKGDKEVKSVRGVATELNIGEEKSIDLFWDTSGFEEGKYTAIAQVTSGEKVSKSEPVEITIASGSIIPGFTSLTTIIAMVIIVAILFLGNRKRGKGRNEKV